MNKHPRLCKSSLHRESSDWDRAVREPETRQLEIQRRAEKYSWFAGAMIQWNLYGRLQDPLELGDIARLRLWPASVGRMVLAARQPLADGKTRTLKWFSPPKGQTWWISTDGAVTMMVNIGSKGVDIGERFFFDEVGVLLRSAVIDYEQDVVDHGDEVIRTPDERSPLPLKEVLAALSVPLGAFGALRLSLTADANKGGTDFLRRLAKDMRGISERLRDPRARVLAESAAVAAIINDVVASEAEEVRLLLEAQREPAARIKLMGPLSRAYELVFGKPAGVNDERTDSPFIRFSKTFLSEVGAPCEPTTIATNFKQWRREEKLRLAA